GKVWGRSARESGERAPAGGADPAAKASARSVGASDDQLEPFPWSDSKTQHSPPLPQVTGATPARPRGSGLRLADRILQGFVGETRRLGRLVCRRSEIVGKMLIGFARQSHVIFPGLSLSGLLIAG